MCLAGFCSTNLTVTSEGYFSYIDPTSNYKVFVQPFGSQDGGLAYF